MSRMSGPRLKVALNRVGWTSRELAQRVGVDPSTITYVTRGQMCSQRTARGIADAIVRADPDMEFEMAMWLLMLGFAPTRMLNARLENKIRALYEVGIKACMTVG